ncbi:hypothetical protein MRQ36_26055 [Micromonospora sp. R77]|uniref:hypothetical protein n=1 Tax=Micromonospora sp. R77 TaxID=2925836 RepID=UPI001F608BE2|nr:hypothetical protein [Micromonospora sp. R77]
MVERGRPVPITGVHALSALGRGVDAQLAGVLAGTPAFGPVRRFDTTGRRVTVAATLPQVGTLADELTDAVDRPCRAPAWMRPGGPSRCCWPLHGGPTPDGGPEVPALAGHLAGRCGLGGSTRVYTTACVSASTAVADAAT